MCSFSSLPPVFSILNIANRVILPRCNSDLNTALLKIFQQLSLLHVKATCNVDFMSKVMYLTSPAALFPSHFILDAIDFCLFLLHELLFPKIFIVLMLYLFPTTLYSMSPILTILFQIEIYTPLYPLLSPLFSFL